MKNVVQEQPDSDVEEALEFSQSGLVYSRSEQKQSQVVLQDDFQNPFEIEEEDVDLNGGDFDDQISNIKKVFAEYQMMEK